jgi:hypothetical protein
MLTLTALSISQDTKYLTEFKDGICKMQGKMSFTDEASLVATFIANECNNDYRMKKRTPAKYCLCKLVNKLYRFGARIH